MHLISQPQKFHSEKNYVKECVANPRQQYLYILIVVTILQNISKMKSLKIAVIKH